MSSLIHLLRIVLLVMLGGGFAQSQSPPRPQNPGTQRVGPQKDGSVLLPNGWTITPAGKQVALSTLPMSMAVSPDEKYLLVLNGGFLPPTISVIDLESETEVARAPVEDGWLGLTFNAAGDKVYIGGGSTASVFEFEFKAGALTPGRVFPVVPASERRDSDHIGDVALSPDGRFLYAANLFRDSVTVMNTQTGFVVRNFKTGRRPYRLLMGRDGETLLISHWAESSIGLYSLSDGRLIERVSVGPHPSDMLLKPGGIEVEEGRPPIVARLFVACSNSNSVWAFGLTEGNRFQTLERISVAPTPNAPAGSTPTALALSGDGSLLYVVASDINAIVVADVTYGRAEPVGVIPTGWYPTAVKALKDGRLLYLNGKGGGSHPAPKGPDPTRRGEESQYVAALQSGSLGILPPLNQRLFSQLTERVIANTAYSDSLLADAGIAGDSPIPNRPGDPSPIRHVIYVVKENRTFDQVLGAMKEVSGDAGLVVFGESVTPNHHKLAREFVLLDNFYTSGDVSADGQNWSVAAIANDFVQKLWPSYYGRRRRVYDFEGGEPAAVPPAGYLWANVIGKGLTVRNYGIWAGIENGQSVRVRDPGLAPHTNTRFRPFDLDYPDQKRVDEFLREFQQLEAENRVPDLMIVHLPGGHTAGRAPGKPTARAMMAEHDQALGALVEAVSRSESWPRTAIFVIEDDSQDGADHIDSHRSLAFVISPYAKRGFVDSTLYTTTSVLRTIELILGLQPMTQFDAAAKPLAGAFTSEPDTRLYEALEPKISLDERNPPSEGGQPRRVENHLPLPATPVSADLAAETDPI